MDNAQEVLAVLPGRIFYSKAGTNISGLFRLHYMS